MKRRKLLAGASSSLAALSIVGTAKGQTKELRMGTPFVNGSNLHKGMQKFAEIVNAGAGGRFRVLVYTDSQIGDIQQLLSGMQLGTVDMAYLGIGNGASLKGGGPLNIGYTPYLFTSKANAERILNGPIFAPMFEDLAKESGVRAFCAAGARSGRALQTVKGSIAKPDDLKGMRLRIPPIPIFKDAFESVGVRPVPMGLSDIYQALSRGQVDGQDNGFDLSLAFKWHEVAKHWSATDHVFELATWYMSEKLWATLTPADRELFVRAAREGGGVTTALEAEITRNGIEELKKNGVTYTVPDVPAFKAAFAPSIRNYEGKLWPDGLVARIHAMQA
jgi:TRAP-type C4-dicarboxylate transport system substrate-binding protein